MVRMMDDREKAAKELGVPADYIDHYSFPQAFGSSSGPFSRPGGQMFTSFQIDAYTDGKTAIFYCCGERVKRVDNWEFQIKMP